MSKLRSTLQNFSLLDELSKKESAIHNIHPLVLLLCTILYIAIIASFDKYEIFRLIPFAFYPAVVFGVSQIPVWPIIKRSFVILPVILGIGLINFLFDKNTVNTGGMLLDGGLASLISLVLKYALTVIAALLMMATTGINKFSYAMRMLKIPRLLVLQITLTYRYISVLSEEVMKTTLAYSLRSFGHKGVKANAWGPLAGQIMLRTFDRAQYVYRAMSLRGFNGDYHPGKNITLRYSDAVYFVFWVVFFTAARLFDIPALLGSLFGRILF